LLQKHRVQGTPLDKYLQRPEVDWPQLASHLPELDAVADEVREQVIFDVKYSGYLVRQEQQVERQKRLADKRIPDNFDFASLPHLRIEAREKLSRIRPISLAQAGRISGITPADVALLLAHLEGRC
jgi:tRNA uridine 5-carboxymethylaminomethyl modification enzyme